MVMVSDENRFSKFSHKNNFIYLFDDVINITTIHGSVNIQELAQWLNLIRCSRQVSTKK